MDLIRDFEEARSAFQGETTIALDLETGGFSAWTAPIHVISLYGPLSKRTAILHYPRGVPVPQEVMNWLNSFEEIITHNGVQFDYLFLANNGYGRSPKIFDTLIGEQVSIAVGRRDVRVNLADTLKRRLGKTIDKSIDHAGWGAPALSETHVEYCKGDIQLLSDLQIEQIRRCSERETTFKCLMFEMQLAPAIVDMELTGMPFSLPTLKAYTKEQEAKIAKASVLLLDRYPGIKLSSNVQWLKRLQEKYGAKLFPKTDAPTLEEVKRTVPESSELYEEMAALLLYRGAQQRANMYGEEWVQEFVVNHGKGRTRVHGKFWQVGTDTGRMSGGKPNLQQVTKDMRYVFGHEEGVVVGKSDLKQIEVRVAAALANDMIMIAAINRGEDIHSFVASQSFGVPIEQITKKDPRRDIAKAMNFLLLFGGGVGGLFTYAQANDSVLSRAEIQAAYDNYFDRFPGIGKMKEGATKLCARRDAVPLTYPTGLRRILTGGELRATVMLNNLVQGTAAAGLKKAILLLWERGLSGALCCAVHDELVYLATPSTIEEVTRQVEDALIDGLKWALEDCPPIKIGVDSTWGASWKGEEKNERTVER